MSNIRFCKILLLFLMLAGNTMKAQYYDQNNYYSLSALISKGYIYAHTKSLNYIINNYVGSFNIELSRTMDGSKLWHQQYHIPKTGLAYSYTDLGNPKLLGHANTIYTFIVFRGTERKWFVLSYKCAAGLAWLSKKYDIENNRYNIAIGSKLNAYLNLNVNVDFKLSSELYFCLGAGMSHFSNGATQQPNKGINIFAAHSGLQYHIPLKDKIQVLDSLPRFKPENEFSFIYSAGIKTLEPAKLKKYYVTGLSMNAERQLSYKCRIGVGLDIFKDNSRKEYLVEENIENPKGKDLLYAGCHVSYDLVVGNSSFTIQMGGYFWQKAKCFESVYHRFGLKYRFSEHWMACLTLKTFWADADFAEWGIGYRF